MTSCPSDPEIERPKNYVESISGDQTWDKYGIRIKWLEPTVPGNSKMPINESCMLRMCLEVRKGYGIRPEDLSAWCWTHIRTQENKCGIWREIRLHYTSKYNQIDPQGNLVILFQSSIVPTDNDLYRLTYNVKYNKVMIWANYFQEDNIVNVQTRPSSCLNRPKWQCMLASVPQTISAYAHYFMSLFSMENIHNLQSTSAQLTNCMGAGRKGDREQRAIAGYESDNDVEMLIRL